MKEFQAILITFDDWLWGNWLLFVLLGVSLLYTITTGGIQVKHFGYIIEETIWEPIRSKDKGSKEPGITFSFQALCTTIASYVRSGNIVGVSTAVLTGGMGTISWVRMTALVGMVTKYGEIILDMFYRERNEKGSYVGGPMYYIKRGLRFLWLTTLCALSMVTQIIGGNLIQSNATSDVMKESFDAPHLTTGIVFVLPIFITTLGGLKHLAHVARTLVPLMMTIYVAGGICIILADITKVPGTLVNIFAGIFGMRAMVGSAMGTMPAAMQKGAACGLYPNEAGKGSVPMIHSVAQVNHPVEQGTTDVTEILLDTLVTCTITGLVLGVTGVPDSGMPGNMFTINTFASTWRPMCYVMASCLLLFSSVTLMSQWHFGLASLNCILGIGVASKSRYVFSCFCIVGTLAEVELIWVIQDITLGFLTIPNLTAMAVLALQARKVIKGYFSK